MKKFIATVLAVAMAVGITGCAKTEKKEPSKDREKAKKELVLQKEKGERKNGKSSQYNFDEQVILDEDGFTVTANSLQYNKWDELILTCTVENSSEEEVLFQIDKINANGYAVDALGTSDWVKPGKTATLEVEFFDEALAEQNIDTIDELRFTVTVNDKEYDEIASGEGVIYPTGKASVEYADRETEKGEVVVVDNDVCTLVLLRVVNDPYNGDDYCIRYYFENKTDKPLRISTDDSYLNDRAVDSYTTNETSAHGRAYGVIGFSEDDMEKNGIDNVESVELYFHVYDTNNYDTIIEDLHAEFNPA